MKVEILYIEGCPNVHPARQAVEHALAKHGVKAKVRIVLMNEGRNEECSFAGSPTIRINGRDIESAGSHSFSCRIFSNGKGVPSQEACERAVAQALQDEGEQCNAAS